MSRAAALLAALLLAGCGSGDDPAAPIDLTCDVIYQTTFTDIGETGLMLAPQEGAHLSFAQMESAYRSVENCAGVTAPGPWLLFRSFTAIGEPHTFGGFYDVAQRAVWINTDNVPGYPQGCKEDTARLRHEFVHHLLAQSTGDADAAHASPLFDRCGAGRD